MQLEVIAVASNQWRSAKVLAAFGIGMLVSGVGVAFAASLGSVTASRVGGGNVAIAACAPSINLQWSNGSVSPVLSTAAVASQATFKVNNLFLSNLSSTCNGQPFKLVIASTLGTQLAATSGTVSGAPALFNITLTSSPGIDSKQIGQVVLVIYQ